MRKYSLLLLLFILVGLLIVGCSSSSNEEPEKEQNSEKTVGQEITYGDYIIKTDKISLNKENNDLGITLTITNNSAETRTADDIIGVMAFQGDTTLSDGNNFYHGPNELKYEHTIQSGASDTIEIQYRLDNLDTPVEFSVFNDSGLGLSDQGLGSDLTLTINPSDLSFESKITNEPNHG